MFQLYINMEDRRSIEDIVKEYDKNIVLRPKQLEAQQYIRGGKGDLIVNLPVGYGKSLIYHIVG